MRDPPAHSVRRPGRRRARPRPARHWPTATGRSDETQAVSTIKYRAVTVSALIRLAQRGPGGSGSGPSGRGDDPRSLRWELM